MRGEETRPWGEPDWCHLFCLVSFSFPCLLLEFGSVYPKGDAIRALLRLFVCEILVVKKNWKG